MIISALLQVSSAKNLDLLESQNYSQDPHVEHLAPKLLDPTHSKIRDRLIEDVLEVNHPAAMSVLKNGKEYWVLKLKDKLKPSTLEEYVQQRTIHSAFVYANPMTPIRDSSPDRI